MTRFLRSTTWVVFSFFLLTTRPLLVLYTSYQWQVTRPVEIRESAAVWLGHWHVPHVPSQCSSAAGLWCYINLEVSSSQWLTTIQSVPKFTFLSIYNKFKVSTIFSCWNLNSLKLQYLTLAFWLGWRSLARRRSALSTGTWRAWEVNKMLDGDFGRQNKTGVTTIKLRFRSINLLCSFRNHEIENTTNFSLPITRCECVAILLCS